MILLGGFGAFSMLVGPSNVAPWVESMLGIRPPRVIPPEPVARAQEVIDRARAVLPAGSFGNMASDVVIARGKGGRIWDLSGNEYVDFLLGSGPMFVGHDHPEVTAAVQEQIPKGTTFFANNEHGVALAESICEAMACADKLRFVSSGSEATLYAMRTARAHRKRDKVLKFEGGFHGMSDYPPPPGEAFPDTPELRAWDAEYNTRPARRLLPRLIGRAGR